MDREKVLNEAATRIHKIWESADTCPLAKSRIKSKCETMLNNRKTFLRKIHPTNPAVHSEPSEFTRKRRLPSTSREKSIRLSTSIYKSWSDMIVEEEVQLVMNSIIDSVISNEVNQEALLPRRRMQLRNDNSPEAQWQAEEGYMLFDVFSEQNHKKA